MSVSAAQPISLHTPKAHVTQAQVVPAPIGGMDSRIPLAMDNPNNCIWAINMVPNEYSMRVRNGYREWQLAVGEEVRSCIPYLGKDGTKKMFVATEDGIFEVSTHGGTPTLKVAFATQSDDAGYGVYTAYVDESGDDLMLFADGENGLFRYDPDSNTWAQATNIQAKAGSLGTLTITNIVFVMVHKLRIWMFEKDSNKAWYLPIRSATGDASEFFFGSKFKFGGGLAGLYNWTIDGGLGRDDHLVAISKGGDVIPWTGEDPADSTTWTNTGTFYIGPVPKGHLVASEYGGELFVLSKFGITPMSALLSGAVLSDPFANTIGNKISRLLRADLEAYGNEYGWSVRLVQSIGSLLITVPLRSDGRYRQYVYNIATQGWGTWRDVPIISCDNWDGALMFGTADGNVYRMDTDSDNVTIADNTGEDIEWLVLTSYSHFNAPAIFKQAKFVRTNFVSQREPIFNTAVYYDYITTEPEPVAGATPAPSGDVWDTGLWGNAIWGLGELEPFNKILGSAGLGRSMAIALVGKSIVPTDLASFDIMWEAGGML